MIYKEIDDKQNLFLSSHSPTASALAFWYKRYSSVDFDIWGSLSNTAITSLTEMLLATRGTTTWFLPTFLTEAVYTWKDKKISPFYWSIWMQNQSMVSNTLYFNGKQENWRQKDKYATDNEKLDLGESICYTKQRNSYSPLMQKSKEQFSKSHHQ